MRNTKSYKGKMHNRFHQITILILAVVFVAACTSAPTPTLSQTGVTPTPVVTASAPTDPPPTVAQFTTVTNPPSTTVPSTEEVGTDTNQDHSNVMESNRMNIQVGEKILTATLVQNSSSDALKEALSEGPITINMRDYGSMEKVGSLGMDLPQNNEQITTEAGDIILFQGNMFVIYYAPNSWNFTRLGKVINVTAEELREILGDGDVSITLSLPQE